MISMADQREDQRTRTKGRSLEELQLLEECLQIVTTCSTLQTQLSKRSGCWFFKTAKSHHPTPYEFWSNVCILLSTKRRSWNPFLSLRDNINLIMTLWDKLPEVVTDEEWNRNFENKHCFSHTKIRCEYPVCWNYF